MKKKIVCVVVSILFSFTAFSQSVDEELTIVQELFGMEKKAAIAAFLQLEGSDAEGFWALYDAYETDRKALGKKRIDILNKYADSYFELDDEKTDALMKETIALSKAYDKLIAGYYKKMKKSNGVKTATQFYQIEVYLKSYIRTVIFSSMPFVGEIE